MLFGQSFWNSTPTGIQDVEDAVPIEKNYRSLAKIFPRPAGEGQGEGLLRKYCYTLSVKIFWFFTSRFRNVEDAVPYKRIIHLGKKFPRPAGEGQGEGKQRKYRYISSVKIFWFFASRFGTSRTPSHTKILWIISKSIYFFASHFRDVEDAVPYKNIMDHQQKYLFFCKPFSGRRGRRPLQ